MTKILKRAAPPKHLERPEAALWRSIVAQFSFDDPASLELLTAAMEAKQRARRCRQIVDKDGERVVDRFGQLRVHPLIAAERDARAAFVRTVEALHLQLGDLPA